MVNPGVGAADLSVIDTDDAPASKGDIRVYGGRINAFGTSGEKFQVGAEVNIRLIETILIVWGLNFNVFDFQSKSNTTIELDHVSIEVPAVAAPFNLFANHANTTIKWRNTHVFHGPTCCLKLNGDVGTHEGAPNVTGDVAPNTPPIGTEWRDIELKDVLVWDGTYWGANGIYRKDVLVDVSSAALNHDVGFDVPAGGATVSTSFKLLKALTGGGGAVQAGLGTGSTGDPDKYAETASLALGQKDQNLHGTFNDGGGDDLKITAETAPGTAGGTVAGSGDEDARVVVYFKLPKTLP